MSPTHNSPRVVATIVAGEAKHIGRDHLLTQTNQAGNTCDLCSERGLSLSLESGPLWTNKAGPAILQARPQTCGFKAAGAR